MNEVAYRAAEARLWDEVGARPTERRIGLASTGTDVRVQEVGEGPPLLFLHGAPNAGTTFAPLVAQLPGYRCLVPDRPGTGLSAPSRVDRRSLGPFADRFVADVLDSLEIERADIVASSVGGYVGLRSAAATPGRIGRMVQLSCPALVEGMELVRFVKLALVPGAPQVLAALPSNERTQWGLLKEIGHGASLRARRIPSAYAAWALAVHSHSDTIRNDLGTIRRVGTRRGWHPDLVLGPDKLAAVETPTLFVWGAADPFGGEEVARSVVAAMPDAELVLVPDGGHLVWLDDPAYVAAATSAFLTGDEVPSLPVEPPARWPVAG